MEALYNRAKLLEHGAQSPDIPMASAATIQHLTEKHTVHLEIDTVLYNTKHDCQFLSQSQFHVLSIVWNWKVRPRGYTLHFNYVQLCQRRGFPKFDDICWAWVYGPIKKNHYSKTEWVSLYVYVHDCMYAGGGGNPPEMVK